MGNMNKLLGNCQAITAARRGQIIQRVLVDGWSLQQTAQAFNLNERRVAVWIADYRRYGMASLHRGETGIETLPRRLALWLRGLFAPALGRLRRRAGQSQTGVCVVLRRAGDARRIRR